MTSAVYPGSFDPVTYGHLDIIERGGAIFDHLVVAVAKNRDKEPIFSMEKRVELIRNEVDHLDHVEVDSFHGLVVDYLEKKNIRVLLRGIRTVSDFEYEFQMALTNRTFDEDIETLFILPDEKYSFISSSLIKEAVSLGGDVTNFVPEQVQNALRTALIEDSGNQKDG